MNLAIKLLILIGLWMVFWGITLQFFHDVEAAGYSVAMFTAIIMIPLVIVLDRSFSKSPTYTNFDFILLCIFSLLPSFVWFGTSFPYAD